MYNSKLYLLIIFLMYDNTFTNYILLISRNSPQARRPFANNDCSIICHIDVIDLISTDFVRC